VASERSPAAAVIAAAPAPQIARLGLLGVAAQS
jgi:hypothetical protein